MKLMLPTVLPEKAVKPRVLGNAKLAFGAFFSRGETRLSKLKVFAESMQAWGEYHERDANEAKTLAATAARRQDSGLFKWFEAAADRSTARSRRCFRLAGATFYSLGNSSLENGNMQGAMQFFFDSAQAKGNAGVNCTHVKAMTAYCSSKIFTDEGKDGLAAMNMVRAFELMSKAGRGWSAYEFGVEALGLLENTYQYQNIPFCDQLAALATKNLEYDVAGRAYSLAAGHSENPEVKLAYREAAERCAQVHKVLNDTSQKAFEAFLLSGEKQMG